MSTKSSSQKTTTTSYTPAQQEWMGKALEVYGPQIGKGEDIFAGARVAGITPTQQQALGGAESFLDTFAADRNLPLFGETGSALSGILGGTTGAEKITPEATGKFFEEAYQKPAHKAFREDVLPGIKEAYAGPGFFGASRAKGQVKATENLADWLGTKRGELEWDVGAANRAIDEAKAGRSLAAVGPSMAYAGLPTQEAQSRLAGRAGVFDFLDIERQQEQALINESIQKFAEENRITSAEDMQIILSLLGMQYQTTTGKGEGAGLGYAVLSGLAGGAGAGIGYGMMQPA